MIHYVSEVSQEKDVDYWKKGIGTILNVSIILYLFLIN
jgi:hypothetical protein